MASIDEVCDGVSALSPASNTGAPVLPALTAVTAGSVANVVLTDKERQIFEILLHAASTRGSVLRVAGGWVRDKILHIGQCIIF